MRIFSVAKDFSRVPAGRYETDSNYSGEKFRACLVNELAKLTSCERLTVLMDGTFGYGSSFLEEAFEGLVKKCGFTAKDLHDKMVIESSDASLLMEIWDYIAKA